MISNVQNTFISTTTRLYFYVKVEIYTGNGSKSIDLTYDEASTRWCNSSLRLS